MAHIIKRFHEFINESIVDKIQNEGGDLVEYLNANLDKKAFLEFFRTSLEQSLPGAIENENADAEYIEASNDEDGNYEPGYTKMSDTLSNFELEFSESDFGDFGITFSVNGDDISVFAFDGEEDITETELGEAMIDTYNTLFEVTKDAIQKNKDADYREAERELDARNRGLY